MTLRIFEKTDDLGAVIALHGWLSAAEVPAVEDLAASTDGPLTIDLAVLVGADSHGVRCLRGLRDRGARLEGASPFIELMLGGAPPQPGRRGEDREGSDESPPREAALPRRRG